MGQSLHSMAGGGVSLNRYNPKRDANEKEIVDVLRGHGVTVFQLNQPCDILAGYLGQSFTIEIKSLKGKLTKGQQLFADNWNGSPLYVLRTPIDAIEWVKARKKEART